MKVVEYSGLSIPRFAAKIGARTPQAIREITYGNTKTLSYEMTQRIVAAFPELNTGWLTDGEGEMLKSAAAEGATSVINSEGVVLVNSGGSHGYAGSRAVLDTTPKGNQTIKQRLKIFIAYKKISTRAFEAACGFSYGFVGNMRNSMQPDKTMRISQCYPELNTGWLMTGEGEMLKPTAAADGATSVTNSEGAVLINSGGSRVDTNSGTVIYKALDEIAEQRKLTAKAHEQIDRLLSIIERLTNG